MNVDITCFASLSNDVTCSYDKVRSISIKGKDATARVLADAACLRQADISSVFINGRRATIDNRLSDGDRVAFVPAVGGM